MTIGILYPHPLNGSLGSIRRVREIAETLSADLNTKTCIFTPYEQDKLLTPRVSVKSIPNLFLSLGLSNRLYHLSRIVYYNRYLTKSLLSLTAKNSDKIFSKKLVGLMRREKTKVLQAEHDISLYPAIAAGKQLGIPVVADLHNIAAEELASAGLLIRGSKAFNKIQHFVGECLDQVDLVCVVSPYMASYVYSNYGISSKKIVVVTPASRIMKDEIVPVKGAANKVVYSGMVTHREHVDLFIRSIPRVAKSTRNSEFLITEKGDELVKIKRLAKQLCVNLKTFWFHTEEDLFGFLATCRLGVLPSSNDEARKLGTPIKLFDYLSVGLPIVANDVGSWSTIIRENEVGILTEDDPVQFSSAIKMILDDENMRQKLSENALRLVKDKYNWHKSVEPLVHIYDKLI